MALNDSYEEITQDEANFIISLYETISKFVRLGRSITLVGLAHDLGIKPMELSDYLPQIISMLDKVEQEYQIQQGGD